MKIQIDNKTVDRVGGEGEIMDCELCGFTWHKDKLTKQRGFLVCKDCFDKTTDKKNQYKE